jgi:FtsP/CotA-like multicopper oxidase with cupredoxin domain
MAEKVGQTVQAQDTPTASRKRPLLLWILLAVSICIVALALGLGLGLGLKHNSTDETTELAPGKPPITWKRGPNAYVLPPTFDNQAEPTTRSFTFNLSEIPDGAPDGYSRRLLLINGQFPGPVVEANEGDRVVVQVNNQMTIPATIHWHGQYQNGKFSNLKTYKGTSFMDGSTGITQCPIQPNSSFTYNFTLQQYGTYWYHAHYSTIYQDGLVGPLIIHGRNETDYNVQGDLVLMVSDWYHNFSTDLLPGFFAPGNEGVEPVPDSGLMNGYINY